MFYNYLDLIFILFVIASPSSSISLLNYVLFFKKIISRKKQHFYQQFHGLERKRFLIIFRILSSAKYECSDSIVFIGNNLLLPLEFTCCFVLGWFADKKLIAESKTFSSAQGIWLFFIRLVVLLCFSILISHSSVEKRTLDILLNRISF